MANQYVNKLVKDGVTKLDLTGDTVTPETLAEGVTAHDASGAQITGTGRIKPFELGLRADFVNKSFTRLGDAAGLSGGTDFDNFPMYKRRRCNLANNGIVNAYLGDENYAVGGSNGQVMVEQPKFYYKVVPVSTNGSRLNIAEYWVASQQLDGYKLHPAFINSNGQEVDFFYEGAYEGFVENNKLLSVSDVNPSYGVRANHRTYAANRANGWFIETIMSLSADQLLMIIEYGGFNMQSAIGYGCVKDKKTRVKTGTLNSFGNSSYGSRNDMVTAVQWRGKENPWGNYYNKWIDGINIQGKNIYINTQYDFADSTSSGSLSPNYKYVQEVPVLSSTSSSYIYTRYFNYNQNYDWVFIPYKTSAVGDSSLPVGDAYLFYDYYDAYNVASGGKYSSQGTEAGAFFLIGEEANSKYSSEGARLLYVG